MKYFRKYNLLWHQEQTETGAFREYLKGKESILGRQEMFHIMCTQNVERRQEFDSLLRRTGLKVLCVPECLLQKDLGRLTLGL